MFSIQNITLNYNSKKVLDNLSLNINEGNIFGVLGRNGAGKTTLFESIFQNTKYNGQILLQNQPINKRDISYLESENYFYPYLSVNDILNLFIHENEDEKVTKLTSFFNIPTDSIVEKLSLGTKKKLAILCNILIDRPIYLFDEPFNGLDFESVEKFYFIIDELKKRNKIVLISSHIMETLTNCCDHIGHLQNGKFAKIYLSEEYHLIRTHLTEDIQKDWVSYINI
ncbi:MULTISPECIES: ATP-binding cassette domain-containing protein [Chryseobacterium]|uniref:ABC transporter ATP-binding protein n=1 Tax=Chryseobacterium candidae TaxID=1978493 RepID=A0ABY2RFQ4_9FLAO|nr:MULTISPECIES: ATP-binding cassette domain-containing protein [Chryseobacterium]PXW08862.1 ABC-2 type transport system ATP-binding protein [Chryseobacterium sp. CBTAP 102]THV63298.1 ABC transporter ATP-binding protein [Chryseobacterium candidae]